MQEIPVGCYYENINQIIVCPGAQDYTMVYVWVVIMSILAIILGIGWIINLVKLIARGDRDHRFGVRIIGIFIPFIGGIVGWI